MPSALNRPAEVPRPAGAQKSRRPDIQGLRAIAVLTVVAFHAGLPVPGGFVGVDVFFVISGFVITAMLRGEWEATGRIQFGRFYIRRFKRLTPALALVVAFTVIVSTLVLSPNGTQQTAAKTAIGALLLMANVAIARATGGYFDAPAETNPLLNIWSLSVEEQFYLVFPALLAFGWLLSKRVRQPHPVLIVAGVAVVSFALAVFGSFPRTALLLGRYSDLIGFYSPVSRAWEFAVGALLALAANRFSVSSRNLALALGLLGAVILVVSLWAITPTTPFPGTWTLLPVAGTLLLILAGTGGPNTVTRMLSTRPMVRIGDWSYSIYLWHWPFIVFTALIWPGHPMAVLAAAIVSVVPAIASYTWVEQPIRNLEGLSRLRFARLVAATLIPPLLLGAGLWQAGRTWFWNKSLSTAMAGIELRPVGWGDPLCISRIPVDHRDTTQCHWAADARGAPIYLVGDSNAMHFSEAVRAAGLKLHRPVTALGSEGCPLIDVFLLRKSDPPLLEQCREDYIAMMDLLVKQPPGLVLIASVDRYWRDTVDYRVSIDGDFTNDTPNADALDRGLQRTVERLQKHGHTVLLLQAIPSFTMPAGSCAGWEVLNGSCRPPMSEMSIGSANELQNASRLGIIDVAARTGAAVFDFRDYFCPEGTCSTRISGSDLYMLDGYHLNKEGSAKLAETFIKAIESVARSASTK